MVDLLVKWWDKVDVLMELNMFPLLVFNCRALKLEIHPASRVQSGET